MISQNDSPRWVAPFAACVAGSLVAALYAYTGDTHLDLSDEGFLWYGAIRTAAGDVPLRDFQSYEPGRYYWAAAWSWVMGEGVLALRQSTAVFQALGLFAGLLVARRLVSHPAWLVPVGLVLVLWMFPRHKLFEPALAMMAVYVGLRLLETPARRDLVLSGAFVGLCAFFGRNHALYAGSGILLLTLFLGRFGCSEPLSRRLPLLAAGALLGASPLVGLLVFVPGFGESFLESVYFFVERGSNLPRPVPLPWTVDVSTRGWAEALPRFGLGVAYLLVPLVYGAGVLAMVRTGPDRLRDRSVLIAATAIGIFYAHHASVRSDAPHLAQCVSPALLASIALPRAFEPLRRRRFSLPIWGLLALLTLGVPPYFNPALALRWQAQDQAPLRVAGDELRLPRRAADELRSIDWVVGRRVPADEPIFIAPSEPGLYAVLNRTAPVWRLYFLWAADPVQEEGMIRTLDERNVNWALIWDTAVDGREELRFRNSHPMLWGHLTSRFELVPAPHLPSGYLLMQRLREATGLDASGKRESP